MPPLLEPQKVLCLAGATGTGKTAIAIAVAQEFGGEIVNADSRQVYADFPIITAQPTPAETGACPHHGYGTLSTGEKTTAGTWAQSAAGTARDIAARGGLPILVGGTGLYFHTLLNGIAAIPAIDPEIGKSLAARADAGELADLHRELARLDPAYAARTHPNARQRILRALEVARGTGKPFSWWHANAMQPPLCTGPLLVLDIGIAALEPRLAARIDRMLADGALAEAERAHRNCPDPAAPGWTGIGAAETLEVLLGTLSLDACKERWLARTRAYAKRQRTWFRGRPEAVFLAPEVDAVVAFLRNLQARPPRRRKA
ncbi:MAG: tRNA (adenosine(37)-N6)-dimethylallyltransferase MiaA [Desulfovibrio sp.]|jgi:tRNA dimethylallyltransferase|nr:tRNA (adenosine(37)-N6)-dimethylallyltransferase MiaA [Desulfovibrio sp.]